MKAPGFLKKNAGGFFYDLKTGSSVLLGNLTTKSPRHQVFRFFDKKLCVFVPLWLIFLIFPLITGEPKNSIRFGQQLVQHLFGRVIDDCVLAAAM